MLAAQFSKQLEESFQRGGDDACRLFHGRGHCYPGLEFINVDWFKPVVWVVIYGEPDAALVAALQQAVCAFARQHAQIEAVAWQQRVRGRAGQQVIYGHLPETCYAEEAGARYYLNLAENQNIGFFLDAEPGRQWLRHHAQGKRVLNLFAYTCSFSVAALQGGAAHVVNIDMAKSVIATGQRNHALNQLDQQSVSFLPHDIFRSTRKLEQLGPYDLVVIDPPSRQKGSFSADKDYARLVCKLKPMLAEDALILACLNAPYLAEHFLPDVFAAELPQAQFVERLPQRLDFPEKDLDCCLKMQVFHYQAKDS